MNHARGPHDHPTGGADREDEDLRALLRTADPAADLPAVDPGWTRWKAHQTATRAAARSGERGTTRSRRRRTGLVAGAGLGTAAAAVVAAVTVGTSGAAVTALSLAPAAPGGLSETLCAEVSPEALAQNRSAFEARVTGIEDGQVVLEVTHRFAGEVEDEVTVPQPAADLTAESSPGRFTEGAVYLISTVDGEQVATCGQSGPADPALRSLYERAFGG